MSKEIENKNKREVDMTILYNDGSWSEGNTHRKLHKITIDNKLFEYRIATKNEVKMWKKQLEEKFGKNRVNIEREVEINE